MQNSSLSENLSELFFYGAPFGIALVDSNTNIILQTNDSFCLLLGRSRSEVQGSSWTRYTHPDDLPDNLRYVNETVQRQVKSSKMKRYIRPDDTIIYASITLLPFRADTGRDLHLVIVQDLTNVHRLTEQLAERKKVIFRTQKSIFQVMATLSEFRDRETGEHILRTKIYVKLLLDNLPFSHPYSKKAIQLIADSAMLHDIGKVGIPDNILLKEGRLTPEEWAIMKTHTNLGAKAINRTRHILDNDTVFMFATEISEYHHERWDGTGYPSRLKGDGIPLTARIMAIADVYDALISERPYKPALPHETALAIIQEESGTHFDPVLVQLFVSLERQFAEIARMSKTQLQQESLIDDFGD